jgi:NAD(P)-dependent dehydrogenase (short-subunit alcohol dehydrogenase family)
VENFPKAHTRKISKRQEDCSNLHRWCALAAVAPDRFDHKLIAAKGTIINVISIVGTRVHPFAGSAYATSKTALASLTRELAADFAPHGRARQSHRARSTRPSFYREPSRSSKAPSRCGASAHPPRSPTRSFFLCSPAASYINGAEIHINGGQHI